MWLHFQGPMKANSNFSNRTIYFLFQNFKEYSIASLFIIHRILTEIEETFCKHILQDFCWKYKRFSGNTSFRHEDAKNLKFIDPYIIDIFACIVMSMFITIITKNCF